MERRTILRFIVLVQAVSLLLAVLGGLWWRVPWWTHLHINPLALFGVAVGLITPIISVGGTDWVRRHGYPDACAYIERYLQPAVQQLSVGDIFFVSVISGLCEEALFRGCLQPLVGLAGSSLIFAALHTGTRELLSMGLWALAASLLLGGLYMATGTLWCPMLAHATHNFITMVWLRRRMR